MGNSAYSEETKNSPAAAENSVAQDVKTDENATSDAVSETADAKDTVVEDK